MAQQTRQTIYVRVRDGVAVAAGVKRPDPVFERMGDRVIEVPVYPDDACVVQGVRYPRHEEWVPRRGRCTCVRCGEILDAAGAVAQMTPSEILQRQGVDL